MKDEPELVMSRHCQTVRKDGCDVRVHIYSTGKNDWILEVEDAAGGSTVWKDQFETDDLAFKEFQETVERDGIWSFETGRCEPPNSYKAPHRQEADFSPPTG